MRSKYKFGSDELHISFALKNDEVKFGYQTIAEPNFHSFLYCVFQSILQAQAKVDASQLLEMSHSILTSFGGEIELESAEVENDDDEDDEDEEEDDNDNDYNENANSATERKFPVNGWSPNISSWNVSDYPKYPSSIKDIKTYITNCFDDDDSLIMRILSYDNNDESSILKVIQEYFPRNIEDLNAYSVREARELDALPSGKARILYYRLRKLGAIVAIRSVNSSNEFDISPDINCDETLVIQNND